MSPSYGSRVEELARIDQVAAEAGVHLPSRKDLPLPDADPILEPGIRLFAALSNELTPHGVDVAAILTDARHKAILDVLTELVPGFDMVDVEYRALQGVTAVLLDLLDKVRAKLVELEEEASAARARAIILDGIRPNGGRP